MTAITPEALFDLRLNAAFKADPEIGKTWGAAHISIYRLRQMLRDREWSEAEVAAATQACLRQLISNLSPEL